MAELVGGDAATLVHRYHAYNGSPYDLVPLERGVPRDAALLIGEESEKLPGIVVEVDPVREYLDENGEVDGSLLAHILGYTGPVDARSSPSWPTLATCPMTSSGGTASRPASRPSCAGPTAASWWSGTPPGVWAR